MEIEICYYCDGKLKDTQLTLNEQENGDFYIIEDVPARICTRCGEKYFDSRVLKKIEEMLESKVNVERVVSVPVMKYKVA